MSSGGDRVLTCIKKSCPLSAQLRVWACMVFVCENCFLGQFLKNTSLMFFEHCSCFAEPYMSFMFFLFLRTENSFQQ